MKLVFARLTTSIILTSASLFAFSGTDLSRTADAAPAPVKKEAAPVANLQLVEAIYVLQSVKRTLEAADHDYGGHRAAAVRDIGAAERQLREALGAPVKGRMPPRPHYRESQILSDMQVAASMPVLAETIVFLSQADHDYGGHRARAIADLRAAIAQLERALEYSAVHNWGGDYRVFSRMGPVVIEVKHVTKKHLHLMAVHKTRPHHHHVTLAGTISSARKMRIAQRQAYAKLKGTTATHALLQKKPHLPPHSAVAQIHTIVKHQAAPARKR